MRDDRLAARDFNPYDLGEVARFSREFRERGYRGRYSEPYIPPRPSQNDTPSATPVGSAEAADKAKP